MNAGWKAGGQCACHSTLCQIQHIGFESPHTTTSTWEVSSSLLLVCVPTVGYLRENRASASHSTPHQQLLKHLLLQNQYKLGQYYYFGAVVRGDSSPCPYLAWRRIHL